MVAGTAACIWSDDPSLTNDQVQLLGHLIRRPWRPGEVT